MTTPSIAIIGTEASGKTVFLTVLAKFLSRRKKKRHGILLEPLTLTTAKYIENAWVTLQKSEWPQSTPLGKPHNLEWRLHVGFDAISTVRVVDAAGQDLRRLFANEEVGSQELPEYLKSLQDDVRNADIVVFVINLGDFIGVADAELRTENEWAIKGAIDFLLDNPRPRSVCIVLTQSDLYREYAEPDNNWHRPLQRYLPVLYQAHVASGHVKVFPVAAVMDTRVMLDSDGRSRRVPLKNSRCHGFLPLIEWLNLAIRRAVKPQPTPEPPPPDPPPDPKKPNWWYIVVTILLGLSFAYRWWSGSHRQQGLPPPPPEVQLTLDLKYGVLQDDILAYNSSPFPITNVNIAARITRPNGGSEERRLFARRIESQGGYQWPNEVSVPKGSTISGRFTCDQQARQ